MADYGRPLEFGVSVAPNASAVREIGKLAALADSLGVEFLGVQDHPYQWRFAEAWMLMADVLARTNRLRVFPDVANLPLRLPSMIAKQAATLDVLSGGRFELGLGAGAFWDAIRAMGGPARSGRESFEALEEALQIIRLAWSGERTISFEGRHYSVSGLHPGPQPAHHIGIWLGVYRPRALGLVGRTADGWVPSLTYAPPEVAPAMHRRIDEAAVEAGRDPGAIRRLYNLGGELTDDPATELLHGPADHWVEAVTEFVLELGFDTFVFWPVSDPLVQVERFASEVVPGVREAVAQRRSARPL
jgi:alkanesulfonate monooxygenase SsuD/methylene tetrahydromethanopterin reductase-like flavin-dependent oxidoreductase (luciferase family)